MDINHEIPSPTVVYWTNTVSGNKLFLKGDVSGHWWDKSLEDITEFADKLEAQEYINLCKHSGRLNCGPIEFCTKQEAEKDLAR